MFKRLNIVICKDGIIIGSVNSNFFRDGECPLGYAWKAMNLSIANDFTDNLGEILDLPFEFVFMLNDKKVHTVKNVKIINDGRGTNTPKAHYLNFAGLLLSKDEDEKLCSFLAEYNKINLTP